MHASDSLTLGSNETFVTPVQEKDRVCRDAETRKTDISQRRKTKRRRLLARGTTYARSSDLAAVAVPKRSRQLHKSLRTSLRTCAERGRCSVHGNREINLPKVNAVNAGTET